MIHQIIASKMSKLWNRAVSFFCLRLLFSTLSVFFQKVEIMFCYCMFAKSHVLFSMVSKAYSIFYTKTGVREGYDD